MRPPQDHASKQREQRAVLLIGTIVAGLPILFQILMASAMLIDPGAFPKGDKTLSDARFWPIQIVLLCVAVSGNAAVDWIRVMRRPRNETRPSLTIFLLLVLFFVFVSIMFSVSLLDDKIGWGWLIVMSFFGLVDLIAAYLLEMGIAILDVDPPPPGQAGV
jgi:uncharacterized membrane protein HdeD (DUF308 family)